MSLSGDGNSCDILYSDMKMLIEVLRCSQETMKMEFGTVDKADVEVLTVV